MPPPVEEMSDEESGDIPFSTAPNVPEATDTNGKDVKNEDEEEDADVDEDEEEDTYVIDKIVGHDFDEGDLKLHVKWEGYEDPSDLTREPEGNLEEDAPDMLKDYFKSIGGRPEKPAKGGPKVGRKRKTTADSRSTTPSVAAANEPKRPRKLIKAEETPAETDADEYEDHWLPKSKDWDKELKVVDTIIRDPESGGLFAFLLWNNGKKTRVSIETCYEKCPRMMLKFYEKHLVFKDS